MKLMMKTLIIGIMAVIMWSRMMMIQRMRVKTIKLFVRIVVKPYQCIAVKIHISPPLTEINNQIKLIYRTILMVDAHRKLSHSIFSDRRNIWKNLQLFRRKVPTKTTLFF